MLKLAKESGSNRSFFYDGRRARSWSSRPTSGRNTAKSRFEGNRVMPDAIEVFHAGLAHQEKQRPRPGDHRVLARPFAFIPSTSRPTTAAATATRPRASTTRPSPTTTSVLRFSPKEAAAYYNRGTAYSKNGNCTQAVADYYRGDQAQSEVRQGLLQPRPSFSPARASSIRP